MFWGKNIEILVWDNVEKIDHNQLKRINVYKDLYIHILVKLAWLE